MDSIRQEKMAELTRMHNDNTKWLDGYLEDIESRTNDHIADLLKTPGRRKSPVKKVIHTIAEIETLSPLRNPFEVEQPSPSPSPAFTTPNEQSPVESPAVPKSTTLFDQSPAPPAQLATSTTSMDMFVPLKDDSDKQQEELQKSFKHALASTPSSVFAKSPAPNRKSTLNFASLPPREPITAKKSSITKKSSVGSSLMWNLAAQAQAAKQALEQELKEKEAEEMKEREQQLKQREAAEEERKRREAAVIEQQQRLEEAKVAEQQQRDKEAEEKAAAEQALRDQEIEVKRLELSQKRQQERPPTGHAESALAKKRKVFTDASKDMRIKTAPKVIKIKVAAPSKPPVVETKQPAPVKKPALPNKPDIKNVKAKVDTGLRPAQSQQAKTVRPMQATAIKTSNAPIQFAGKPPPVTQPATTVKTSTTIVAKTSTAHYSSAKSSAASTTTVATTSTKATTLSGPAPPTAPAVPSESIELPEIDSEYSSDDDQSQKKKKKKDLLPQWAQSPELRWALAQQQGLNPDHIFGNIKPIQMEEIFKRTDKKFRARTSSANWTGTDRLTLQEEQEYYKMMGFEN